MFDKSIALLVASVLMLGAAAAQNAPLTDFEFEPENGFEAEMSGGEEHSLQAEFENLAGKDLPLVVNITVSSSEGMNSEGREFDFDAVLESDNGESLRESSMECSHQGLVDEETSYFSCYSDSLEVLQRSQSRPSENELDLTAEVAENIVPGSYSFRVDILSQVGVPAATVQEEIEAESPQPVEVEGESSSAEVEVNPESDATVKVQVYEEVSTEPPESDRELVSGVDVQVSDEDEEVDASGSVTIEYDQSVVSSNGLEEGEMDVYYYDQDAGIWTSEDTTVTEHDLADNTITAEVPHFSVYAAYAEEEQEDGREDDSGGSTFVIDDEEQDEQQESTDDKAETDDRTQEESPSTGEEETGGEDDTGQETEQTGEESGAGAEPLESPGSDQSGLTAAFGESPTGGTAALIVAILATAGAVYLYRGEKIRSFMQV